MVAFDVYLWSHRSFSEAKVRVAPRLRSIDVVFIIDDVQANTFVASLWFKTMTTTAGWEA